MNIPFLNLLPPDRRRHFNDLLFYAALRRSVITLGVTLLVAVGLLVGARFVLLRMLAKEHAATVTVQERVAAQNGSSLDQQIRTFNQLLTDVNGSQERSLLWMPILNDFVSLISSGITLTSTQFTSEGRAAVIRGTAATRDDLIALQNAIAESPRFENPTTPISNLVQRENIAFELGFTFVLP